MTSTTIQAMTLALFFLLSGAGPASGQAEPDGRPTATVHVHGHWILEVRDGERRVERREFENELVAGGGAVLAEVLAGLRAPGGWSVWLKLDACSFGDRYDNGTCQPWGTAPMTARVPTEGANAGRLVLQGTAADWVVNTGETVSVEGVLTWLDSCEPSQGPAACDSDATTYLGLDDITQKTGIDPLPIAAGQDVLVTVILSFH